MIWPIVTYSNVCLWIFIFIFIFNNAFCHDFEDDDRLLRPIRSPDSNNNNMLSTFTGALSSFFAPSKRALHGMDRKQQSNNNNNNNVVHRKPSTIHSSARLKQVEQKMRLRDSLFIYPQAQATGDVCELPQVIGTGPYRIPRWYYNPNTRRCELFYYSGCCGNGNNFPTYESCQVLCEAANSYYPNPLTSNSVCNLPLLVGTGRYCIPRWYFNGQMNKCQFFFYSGCDGNANNFPTHQLCQSLCEVDPCTQPKDSGVGSLQIPRFHFNQATKMCEHFVYFGSGGNRNNFPTLAECRSRCPESPNPCAFGDAMRAGTGSSMQCGFSLVVTNTCPINFYCHVGSSVATTICCPKPPGFPEKCTQPLRLGFGSESLPRWYFDPIAQDCREFEYHGLQGNENNFLSKADCENACFANPCSTGNPYRSGGAVMQCNPLNPQICPPGQYCHIGGDARTTVCCPATGEPCTQALSIGNGKLSLNRYYYDLSSKMCKPFKYSGSGGNQNNFQSEQECKKLCKVFVNACASGEPLLKANGEPMICVDHSSCSKNYWCHFGSTDETTMCCSGAQINPCVLPLAIGRGDENLPRWFFDARMKKCTVFTYAGYGGNQNNFRTREECLSNCPEFINPCPTGDPIQQPGPTGTMIPVLCKPGSDDVKDTCPSNGWCHIGASEETTVCCPNAQDPCAQPVSAGVGNLQLPRWYYNPQTLSCQQFSYAGTKGNENDFLSRQDCEVKCPVFRNPCSGGQPATDSSGRPRSCHNQSFGNPCGNGFYCHIGSGPETTVCCPSIGNPCELALSTGLGNQNLSRFYYNPITRQCSQFTYRGTMGNDNNFLTESSCASQCPVFVNPCPGGLQEVARSQLSMPVSCAQTKTCPTNSWCHFGSAADTTVCCPGSSENRCELPLALGSGTANLPRWYFNSNSKECVAFQYRGLYGNANSFTTKEECERTCPAFTNACATGQPFLQQNKPQTCGPTVNPCPSGYWCHVGASIDTTMCCPGARNPCDIPYTAGVGNSQLQRWYYDYSSRSCITFQYRGLMGNPNNFLTKDDCESLCPVWINPCPSGQPVMGPNSRPQTCNPKSASTTCPLNYYCLAGATVETTVCCPGIRNGCEESLNPGQGDYALPRWYFDTSDRSCKQFTYRGLKGNQNNFVNREDCAKECPVFVNPCPGASAINPTQVHYCNPNIESSCPSNQWCHIGADRDTTLCCPNAVDPCTLPQARGTGAASMPRFYYDPNVRQCFGFIYTGIGGNQNNFLTQSQCETRCPVFQNPCRRGDPYLVKGRPQQCSANQPCPKNYWCHIGSSAETTVCCQVESENPCVLNLETGTGTASVPRWYYNVMTQQCAQFSYLGLKGNQNDFLSKQDCEKTCRVFPNPCIQGEPYLDQEGMPVKCGGSGNSATCPRSYWCHNGDSIETTVCCPGAVQSPCEEPMSVGSGNGQISRFYFNAMSRSCMQFLYRGSKGTQNNFKSVEECQSACPVTPNPCRNGEPLKDPSGRWQQCSSVSNRDRCGLGYWCHIGGDVETTICCPGSVEPTEACLLPMVMGVGNSSLPRWYYNSLTRQCLTFNYKGLYGNQNNFVTKTQCEQICPVLINPCPQGQPIQGPGGVPQFCTPMNLGVCTSSTWCHIGADKESSVCCPGAIENVCMLEQAKGNGQLNLPRWSFDQNAKKCVNFIYSGSGGNQNNFLTREDCLKKCPEFQNPCANGEPAPGPGNRPLTCSFSVGCGSGYWCHVGGFVETTVCCLGSLESACNSLTPSEGVGELALTRWFYDSPSKQCKTFLYRGSKGNPNNFLNREDCESICQVFKNPCTSPVQSPLYCSPMSSNCPNSQWCHLGDGPETSVCCPGAVPDPCVQPLNPGSGNSSLPRFYFNSMEGQCYPFTYRGALGNQNNFLTKANCESSCIKYPNPCPTGNPLLGPNNQPQSCNGLSASSSCPSGYWCHVGNTLDSTVCCQGSEDPCRLPVAQGSGDAALPRWYFDQNTKKCTQFTYRGMKGNQNNFVSQDSCRIICREFTNPCIGQPATTPTGQVVFCSATNKDNCPVNFWCHVGAKPETTLCCPGATNPCSVPLSPGTGTENLNRFYYNADSRQCVQFAYNGIGGNQNNFNSKGECEATCPVWINPCSGGPPSTSRNGAPMTCSPMNLGQSCPANYWCHIGGSQQDTVCCPGGMEKPCILAKSVGTGTEKHPRWYFDSLTKKCQSFEYTGRGGNQNNFLTRLDCLKVCPEYYDTCLFGLPMMDSFDFEPVKCLPYSQQCPQGFFCMLDSTFGYCCPLDEFDNPCLGEPEKDERDNPKICFPFLPAQCGFGYFCHVSDSTSEQSSYCCPSIGEVCSSPKRDGEGTSNLQRWYYNPSNRDCEVFYYKGKRGNQNNFLSQEECIRQCVPDINPCFTGDEPYKTGKKSLQCKPGRDTCPATHYCHVSEDSYSTVCCPRRGSPCEQQMLIGIGTSKMPRWYYSREDDDCLPFTYSGRGGNENNFMTQQECETTCPGYRGYCPHAKPLLIAGTPQECGVETACPNNFVCHINTQKSKSICCFDPAYFCTLPRDPGPCSNHTTRYGYNRETGTCTPFQFGGCAGNLNNFRSLERCTEICCDKGF